MHAADPHDLQRFVDAQASIWDEVRAELAAGAKRSHWMWFVFPQLRGLGRSGMARHYGIASRDEAAAYLAHPLLGARLREAVALILAVPGKSAHDIFGSPDDLKLRSCLTLFREVSNGDESFAQALERFYGGRVDDATLELLRAS
jgi:uncharacterized protein (DUF1810 family)